jgi:hypothetical protein
MTEHRPHDAVNVPPDTQQIAQRLNVLSDIFLSLRVVPLEFQGDIGRK